MFTVPCVVCGAKHFGYIPECPTCFRKRIFNFWREVKK